MLNLDRTTTAAEGPRQRKVLYEVNLKARIMSEELRHNPFTGALIYKFYGPTAGNGVVDESKLKRYTSNAYVGTFRHAPSVSSGFKVILANDLSDNSSPSPTSKRKEADYATTTDDDTNTSTFEPSSGNGANSSNSSNFEEFTETEFPLPSFEGLGDYILDIDNDDKA